MSEKIVHPSGFKRRFAEIARSQLRTREVGKNGGAKVREYQSATWLAPGSWPWCAAFVCWCYLKTAQELAPDLIPTRPQTPRAFGFEPWGKLHANFTIDGRKIQMGDIVLFKFSHVGIAVQTYDPLLLGAVAVEGNMSAQSLNNEGDGVWLRTRSLKNVRSVIQLYESAT